MISLWVLVKGFSIIGVSAFGGGATMIKLIQETFVEKYNIIDAAEGNIEFLSLASRGEPLVSKAINEMLRYTEGKFLNLKFFC